MTWAIPEKIQTREGDWGHLIFRGIEKTECGKRSGISTGDQVKIMLKFHGSWYFALEFLRGVTQFCGISRVEAWFCLEFPRVKWQEGFFKKCMPPPHPCLDFFWNSPIPNNIPNDTDIWKSNSSLYIIISSNYRGPVWNIFKEKLEGKLAK